MDVDAGVVLGDVVSFEVHIEPKGPRAYKVTRVI